MRSHSLRGSPAVCRCGAPRALATVQHWSDQLGVGVVGLAVYDQLLHMFSHSLHPADIGPVQETPCYGHCGQQQQRDEHS